MSREPSEEPTTDASADATRAQAAAETAEMDTTEISTDRNGIDPEAAQETDLSLSVVFGILADERRRHVVYYLDSQGGQAEFPPLASQVAAWENDTSVELLTEAMTERVSTGLYHTDLPKLADQGLIEDDFQQGAVTLTETAAQISHYVEFARELEDTISVADPSRASSTLDGRNDG